MKRKIILITIISFLCISTTFVSVGSNNSINQFLNHDKSFDGFMTFLMKLGHLPSLTSCIIIDDEVVWERGYGLYNLEEEKYASKNTIYMVCSISKTITGTALMQLYEKGLLNLDDDVNDYLPFVLRNPHFPDDSITIRMLLSHSSSLNTDPASFYWLNESSDPPFSWYPYPWIEEYIVPGGKYYVPEIWNESQPPGSTVKYSNANFVIIAYLVELLSGEQYIDYCKKNIFEPLDMNVASFSLSEINLSSIAIPYHYQNGKYLKITELDWGDMPPPQDIYYRGLHYPVGGLYTTVSDLSHFLIAHMNGGVYNGSRILEEETVEEMHKNQPPKQGYGLAWYYEFTIYGRVFSGHEGDLPGYHTIMFLQHPKKNVGAIYFINGDRSSPISFVMLRLIRNILFFKANIFLK